MTSIEMESKLSPNAWLQLWDKRVIFDTPQNRSAYSLKNCYIGKHDDSHVEFFYHKEGHSMLLATRFVGTITGDRHGSKISGVVKRGKTTIFFLYFLMVICIVAGVSIWMTHEYDKAISLFSIAVLALVLQNYVPRQQLLMMKRLLRELSEGIKAPLLLPDDAEGGISTPETADSKADTESKEDGDPAEGASGKKGKRHKKNKGQKNQSASIKEAANWSSKDDISSDGQMEDTASAETDGQMEDTASAETDSVSEDDA